MGKHVPENAKAGRNPRLRLDKYMADMGAGTRQEVKRYIHKGLVCVNEKIVKTPDYKVDLSEDTVLFNGQALSYTAYEYYMLHKPAGVVSATRDADCATVVELIKSRRRKDLFPVGRLDKDTEGLVLITNDGELAHRLLSPSKHVDKTYYARVRGYVGEADIQKIASGVNIGTEERPERTRPGRLEIVKASDISEVRLTIQEGKYHQVKRMMKALGKEVVYLRRESVGSLKLDESLKPGEYRPLTEKELEKL